MLYGKNKNIGQDNKIGVHNKTQPEDKLRQEGKQTDRLNFIRNMWANANPKNKRRIVIAGLIFVAVLVVITGYKLSGRSFNGKTDRTAITEHKSREINLDQNMVEKGLYESTQSLLSHQNDKLDKLKLELQKLKDTPSVVTHEIIPADAETPVQNPQLADKKFSIPPPPVKRPMK